MNPKDKQLKEPDYDEVMAADPRYEAPEDAEARVNDMWKMEQEKKKKKKKKNG